VLGDVAPSLGPGVPWMIEGAALGYALGPRVLIDSRRGRVG